MYFSRGGAFILIAILAGGTLFCPCRGLPVLFDPSSVAAEGRACCEACRDNSCTPEPASEDSSGDCACQSGCCTLFVIPEADSLPGWRTEASPFAVAVDSGTLPLPLGARAASADLYLVHPPPLYSGSLYPKLSSLLI